MGWNRSIFYFTTESPVNLPPIIKNPDPANNAIDVPYSNPMPYSFTIEDPEGDAMAMDVETVPQTTDYGWGEWYASNGTYNLNFWFQEYNTTYEVQIDVWDQGSGQHETTSYWYTTEQEPLPPAFSDVDPANNSVINVSYVNWTINITDPNPDDSINWTIECSNGQDISWDEEQYFGSNGSIETGFRYEWLCNKYICKYWVSWTTI